MNMTALPHATTLLVDIGDVLVFSGWNRVAWRRAAQHFGLDCAVIDDRRLLVADAYERGTISLDDYLQLVVFDREQSFSRHAFREFMSAQARPDDPMIAFLRRLKGRYGLKVAAISNTGPEPVADCIRRFDLKTLIDCFICSCFVGCRKPEEEIYRLAMDLIQALPEEVVYIDAEPLFVDAARRLGIQSVCHTSFPSTRGAMKTLGLALEAN